MDFVGITRTIDHAVYMMLNALAIILWRVDAALIGVSMLSYETQDWLTGTGSGGIWQVLDQLIGGSGVLGMGTWQLFLGVALMLFGIGLIARPFFSFRAVDMGRLLFFATLAYVFISQGASMMRNLETWRGEAGSAMYTAMAGSGAVTLPVPGGGGASNEPLYPPAELDGQSPLRGWEAVSTSYFLATSADELHAGVPPRDFRVTYCLYDPAIAIDEQDEENAEGCSPRLAWDEWDLVSTQSITQVWGIPLPGDGISIDLPVYQEHPDNRQLGIRQAQTGVARLALGPLVALFPIVEANVGLMLALAASFIYLSMPIALLFSFFLYTESLVTRLMMQYLTIFIRTLIINGLVALFLLILIGATVNGSLTVYLGLVGVGLAGGWFLMRMAAETMREALAQAMGTVGGIWMGATTAALGEGARRPAEVALGAAKVAAAGATMAAAGASPAGAWRAWDLAEPAYATAGSGLSDIRGRGSATDNGMMRYALGSQTPDLINRMVKPVGQRSDVSPVPLPLAYLGQNSQGTREQSTTGAVLAGDFEQARGSSQVEAWAAQVYQAREQGQGQPLVAEVGRTLLGGALGREAEQAMSRHSQAETMAALQAAQHVAKIGGTDKFFSQDGRLKAEAVQAVRQRMGQAAQAFSGPQGEHDLAALSAAGLQPHQQTNAETFRQAAAEAQAGQGEKAPGRMIPRALGLDPVAAGAHFAALNRFAKVSEQAGLTPEQRQQLLKEAQAGEVSPGMRQQIEGMLRQQQQQGQAAGLKVEDVVASAQAMPETLAGPRAVKLPEGGLSRGKESTDSGKETVPTPAMPPSAKEGGQVTQAPPPAVSTTRSGTPAAEPSLTAKAKESSAVPAAAPSLPLKQKEGALAPTAPAKAPVKPPPSVGKEEAMATTGRVMAVAAAPPVKEKESPAVPREGVAPVSKEAAAGAAGPIKAPTQEAERPVKSAGETAT